MEVKTFFKDINKNWVNFKQSFHISAFQHKNVYRSDSCGSFSFWISNFENVMYRNNFSIYLTL